MTRPTRRDAVQRVAALGAATAWVGSAVLAPSAWAAAPAKGWPAAPGDMSLGKPTAPVHVVEYLSLSCPHCAHFHATVFPAFKAKYVDTGKVYFTLRELLTPPANVAAAGFLMARCGGGSHYFPIVDQVFKSQARWQEGASIKGIFLDIAKANGLTEAQFETCLTDDAASDALEARIKYATDVDKVDSTPTFFVNGVKLDNQHVPSLTDLDAAIAAALKRRGARPPAARTAAAKPPPTTKTGRR